ncbi:mitochondrial hypoxia responsive domain-containing protein [Geopyxis carbonaria]|nr:mitochondrial hypoxia responsive domain-containing protein [Geopyxis carbonaria]
MSNRPLPSSFDDNADFYEENRLAKLGRRLKEEPLIPLGCAVTCWALFKATRSIRAGDKETTNKMFRMRIYGQGFTLCAMLAGSYYYQQERDERKKLEAGFAERKAREKQQAWIKELEIRDQEDKEFRDKAKKLSERRQAQQAEGASIAEQAKKAAQEAGSIDKS